LFSAGNFYQAGIKMYLIQYRPKQSRFTRAVITDQADAAFGMNCPVDVIKQLFI
jgi:hypothetical protein